MKANTPVGFGRVDLSITQMGFGAAPIGNIFRPIPDEICESMVDHAWEEGIRYFDTAPMYGHGLSELRLGQALRKHNRSDFVLSTKVGRLLKAKGTHPRAEPKDGFSPWYNPMPFDIVYDYSYDGTMRSIEDSFQRLGTNQIDVVMIHDIDSFIHTPEMQKSYYRQAMDGAYKALEQLRSEGAVKAIGVGCNQWEVCHQALQDGDFDCFLIAGRYTLLEQEALTEFLPLCEEREIAIISGGAFNSGILATGVTKNAKYNYAPAPAHIKELVTAIEKVCAEFGVSLAAAALQFVLAHPSVKTVIPGTRTVDQLKRNINTLHEPIPADLWRSLKQRRLIRADAPTP